MKVSQKCQYALRAVLELALRYRAGPANVATIAVSQGIPEGFLSVILVQLKNGGYVKSRRGMRGGYELAPSPDALTVGQIVRFIDGPIDPVECVNFGPTDCCPSDRHCVFLPFWKDVRDAVANIYDTTTLQDLIERASSGSKNHLGSNI